MDVVERSGVHLPVESLAIGQQTAVVLEPRFGTKRLLRALRKPGRSQAVSIVDGADLSDKEREQQEGSHVYRVLDSKVQEWAGDKASYVLTETGPTEKQI